MKNIIIFSADSNGAYPVPSPKGGAVSGLIEHLIGQNNKQKMLDMHVVSFYDTAAVEMSKAYPNVHFHWVKVPRVVRWLDRMAYLLVKRCTNKKAISFKTLFSLAYYILCGQKRLRQSFFDIVVLENNIPLSWLIRLSGYKGKVVYHLHNIPRIDAKNRKTFKRCDLYLGVSQFVCDNICGNESALGQIEQEKSKVLYNCIDTEHFRPIENIDSARWKKRFEIPTDAKVVLFAGRLSKEKGVDKLLSAIDNVKTPNVYYMIIGSIAHGDEEKDEYTKLLHTLSKKHEDVVRFTGFISPADMPTLYNIADISVLPSVWDEPAGLTMIESMACGTPIITTHSGGIPEYVGNDCIILDKCSTNIINEIANGIDKYLSDTNFYETTRRKGVDRIRKMFDKKDYLKRFCEVLDEED